MATGAAVVRRETIELAYLVAMQYLPPKQRAVLILRAVLDWSASEAAALLSFTVPAVNGALQRSESDVPPAQAGSRESTGYADIAA